MPKKVSVRCGCGAEMLPSVSSYHTQEDEGKDEPGYEVYLICPECLDDTVVEIPTENPEEFTFGPQDLAG